MLFVRLGSLTDMDVPLRVLLILAGLTGIHSIRVSEVSVKAGGSISIPCLYSSQYTNHVKYLCKGYYWNYCTFAVRTDQKNSAKFSISDDKIQRIFTVTVNELTNDDLYYWCGVEINDGADDGYPFHLSVTTGTSSLYVDNQEEKAFLGGEITIKCHHQSNPGEMRWCRMGSSCVTQPSGSINGTEVTIDTNGPNVFSVTMRGLKTESSGWYLCVSGNLQFPVRLTVTEQPNTRIHSIRVSEVSVKAGGSISIPCLYSSQYTNHVKYLCKGFYWISCTYEVRTDQNNSAKFSLSDDKIPKIFTVTVNELTNDDSYYWCGVEINDGPDNGYGFHLSVTTGTRSLYVDNQEKTAFLGGDITIKCHHQGNPGEMRWCRMGSSCVTQPSGSIDGTKVTIDTNVPNVFSVTMRGLKTESSGWYLCVSGNLQFPVRLTVTEQPTTRIHSIRVSEVSVKAGGSISIPCLYSSQYTNHVKYLCKGYDWNTCTYQVKTNQKNSTKFSISDDKIQKIFTVTVNELTNDNSHYWCAVEINDGADEREYFHLSVTTGTRSLYVDNQEKTAFLGGDVTIKCHHQSNPGEMRWCRMGSSCVTQPSGSIDGTEVTIDTNVRNVFSVTMRGLKTESSGWYLCVSGNLQFPVRLTVTEQPNTRIHSIRVSEVSVKAGGSISIPCLYSSQYTNHVKYLCKGYYWISCTYEVRTDQSNSAKFSISDDKIQKIFTVTVNKLTNDDLYYWCAVDIDGGVDDGDYFHLSVTTGTRSLYVDNQEKTAFLGGAITIKCHHQRNPGEMRWCRMGSSCVNQPSGSIDGTKVTIDTNVPNVFSVTMRGLKTESSGWYLCVSGNLQFPVRLTVTEQPNTRIHSIRVSEVSVKAGGSISIPCLYSSQYTNHVKYLCKGYYWISCTYEVRTDQSNSVKFSISDDKIQKIFTVTVNELTNDDSYYWFAVENNDGADDGYRFHLSVTTGTSSLYVDNQEKTAFLGGDITIKCHHQRNPGEMRWCRMGSSCVTQRSGSIDGTEVTINTNVPNVFSVTMRGLKTESSGWYLCVSGNLQFPVRLTVTEQPNTRIHSIRVSEVSVKAGGSISIPCLYSSQYTNHVKYLCKGYYWRSCTYQVKTNQKNSAKFSISDDKIPKIFTVTVNELTNGDSHYWCAVEINDGPDDRDYFHLSVTTGTRSLYVDNQEEKAFLGGEITIKCHHQRNPGEMRWCRMGSSCVTQRSGSIDGTEATIDTNVPNVFSVTMRGLKTESSGWYLCVSGNLQFPVRLTVTEQPTTRIHSIRVSEVSVKAGGSISIPCLYSSKYTNHVKYLCKGYDWNTCTYQVKTNQKNSAKFSISDDKIQKFFTVTVNELTNDDWHYWCAVEINDGADDGYPFHLSVTTGTRSLYVDNQEKTAFLGGDVTIKCHHQRNPGEMRWCRMGSSCVTQPSGSIDGTEVTIDTNVPNVFSVTMRGLKTESSGWYLCVSGNLQFPVRLTVTEQPTTRIHSIRVSEVSVKAGGSISIPCLYSSQYTNHVKYLCKGYDWISCTYQVKTNEKNSTKFSISDDKIQKIFTVTVNELTNGDSYYWCAVEINDGPDDRDYFHLSVTTGTRSLYVDNQEKTAFLGGDVTIKCHHQRNPGEMRWCRMGSSCVTQRSGSIDGTEVTIDRNVPNVFSVTMRGLKTESSGWYLCVSGNLQFPVRLTVTEQPNTKTPLQETTHAENLSTFLPTTTPTTVQEEQNRNASFGRTETLILTSVLIFTLMVALFFCLMLKRHKQNKSASSAMKEAEEEVTYSVVKPRRKPSSQRSYVEQDADVTYSTVVSVRQQRAQNVEADEENVTYSTLALD
uniref:uncharacterized protein LOC120820825 isoform X4 n=1 Tax=Gasterosteus aculeatus aculeatus TaxID=481459 RepID=UPI001A97ED90|nr:uncharacterized protein LOC120820825 isoform X4 [Gasterosteus aculeatus aculeatus]